MGCDCFWRSCALGSHLFTDLFSPSDFKIKFKKKFKKFKRNKKKRLPSLKKEKKNKQTNKKLFSECRCVTSELWDGACCSLQPSWTLSVVFTLPQGDEALWSLSCTCRLALRKARAPGGSSTPFHVFLNPTPSTEDVI